MQVFWHELQQRRRGFIVLLVAIFAFIVMSMAKYETFITGGAASQKLLESFPATVQAVFGMTGLDLMTLPGYMGILYVYLLLMGGIFASSLGAGALAEEEQGKTTEFLYTKPMSRKEIFTWKYLAVSVLLVLFSLGSYVSILAGAAHFHPTAYDHRVFALFAAALFVVMTVFAAAGMLFAALRPTAPRAGALVAVVVVGAYFAYSLSGMAHMFVFLQRITPFSWFAATDIIRNGHMNLAYVLISGLLVLVLTAVALRTFLRRDLQT